MELADDARFSTNTTPPPPKKSGMRLFWEAFEDSTIVILCVAAIVSLVLGATLSNGDDADVGWVEGVAILMAVIIVATVTAVNEWQKEKQFRALNDVKNNKPVKVMRGGVFKEVSIYDVLAGDVVQLFTGDGIPADGIFLSGHGTSCVFGDQ